MYKRIAVAMLLLLMTVAVARADDFDSPNQFQQVVIELNEVAQEMDTRLYIIQQKIDNVVPLDDFRVVVKKNYIGFTFTF